MVKTHLIIFGLAIAVLIFALMAGLSCAREEAPLGRPLTIIVPDFLLEEWQEPLGVFEDQSGVSVNLTTYPVDAVLSDLMSAFEAGNAVDLAMVYDGWLGELNGKGYLEHLSLESAYFPVLIDNEVLGTHVPWAEGWTVVVPAMSQHKELVLDLLQHPALWMRPMYQLEEYRAFAELLASRGYELVWSERTETSMEVGGIPIEIVVIPTTVKDDAYYELIIARDQKGKAYAQTRLQPAPYRNKPVTVSAATLKTLYDSFMFSYHGIDAAMTASRPGYCTQAAPCIEEKVIECVSNPVKCLLDWISQSLSADERAALGLTGAKTATASFRPEYAWGSRLRAYKLYKAMVSQDNYDWSGQWGDTAARVRNDITYDSGFSWLHGFNLKGTQTLNIVPTGYRDWRELGDLSRLTSPRVVYVARSLRNLFSPRSTVGINAPGLEAMSSILGNNETGGLDIPDIPVDWEMNYDANTQLLTVTYYSEGKACYGVYGMCEVCAVGGGYATAQAKLDGTEVSLEFKLEAYVQGDCGLHPCMHGNIGGGIGIYMDITYPDPCKCLVTTSIGIGWGGHGDALNIMRESCDVYSVAGPSATYDLCKDQSLQTDLNANVDFTSRYGSPVTSDVIKSALADYALVGPPPCQERPWRIVGPADISFAHNVEPSVDVDVSIPPCVALGEEFETTIDMSWVENLADCQYYLYFNPYVIAVTNVTGGKIGYVDIPVQWEVVGPGIIRMHGVVPRTVGVTGSGYLASIRFAAVSPGETNIELLDGVLTDPWGEVIAADWRGASTAVWYE